MHGTHAMRTTTHRNVLSNVRAIRGPQPPARKIRLCVRPAKMSECAQATYVHTTAKKKIECSHQRRNIRCTARTQCAQQLTAPCRAMSARFGDRRPRAPRAQNLERKVRRPSPLDVNSYWLGSGSVSHLHDQSRIFHAAPRVLHEMSRLAVQNEAGIKGFRRTSPPSAFCGRNGTPSPQHARGFARQSGRSVDVGAERRGRPQHSRKAGS